MSAGEGSRRVPVIAVVLAGGVGERTGLPTPKQLIRVAGKPVIEHTIAALDGAGLFDEVLVMMAPGYEQAVVRLAESRSYPSFRRVLPGADTRNATSLAAIRLLEDEYPPDTKVLFHDAVRPFIDVETLSSIIAKLDDFDAVDTVIPSADTLVKVDASGRITEVPPRDEFRRGQTPQGFRLATIARAYARAAGDPAFSATDDCGVVWTYCPETPIAAVPGTPENMKITDQIDFFLADAVFQLRAAHEGPLPDPMGLTELSGKVFAVIGGTEGIGAEVVAQARRGGAAVEVYSRSATGTHVERRADVRGALAACASAHEGRIDGVVLTAGALVKTAIVDASDADIQEALGVNLAGPVLTAQEAYPYLRASAGSLLLFTSSSYTRGRPGYALYSATKAAVVNLTQALAGEWERDRIRVNCINPERTRTPMRAAAFGEEPPETLLSTQQVARAVVDTLMRDFTGQVVSVRRWAQETA